MMILHNAKNLNNQKHLMEYHIPFYKGSNNACHVTNTNPPLFHKGATECYDLLLSIIHENEAEREAPVKLQLKKGHWPPHHDAISWVGFALPNKL